MSVLKYFKNIPRSPPHRATGPKCIFFLQIRNEVPPPYISPGRHMPPSPLSFEPKNSEKKRGVRRRKAAKLCELRTPDLQVT